MGESMQVHRSGRHYGTNPLPVVGAPGSEFAAPADTDLTTIRLHLYSEAVGAWKKLTETRFALLALVPAFSIVAWIQLLGASTLTAGLGSVTGVLISVGGFEVVRSLRIYDQRNDDLYDDVISRARRIESELGVDTGLFRGRPEPKVAGVNHSIPVANIYRVCTTGWLIVGLWFSATGLDLFP